MDGDVGARADEPVRRAARRRPAHRARAAPARLQRLRRHARAARRGPDAARRAAGEHQRAAGARGPLGHDAAVISGRALRDLAALSRLPAEVHLVGSHGSEFDIGFVRALTGRRPARPRGSAAVRGLTDGVPGVLLEEKPAELAVHVRRAAQDEAPRVLDASGAGRAAWTACT